MIFRLLLVLCWPGLMLSAQNPMSRAFNFLKVYELSLSENPDANNDMAIESLLAAKEEIDAATASTPFNTQALTYLLRARVYGSMLSHPRGNADLDRSRPLTIAPTFEALQKYEQLSGKNAEVDLWRKLLRQTFILAYEAEEQQKERLVIERSLEGGHIIAYLKAQGRPLPIDRIDETFASLFVQVLRRDVSTGNTSRPGWLIPILQEWYPENGELWLTYVNYFIRIDQRDQALEAALKAIPLHQDSDTVVRQQLLFTTGNLLVKKDPLQALTYFEAAADLDSNFFGAVYNCGVIYAQLGTGAAEQAMRIQDDRPDQARQLVRQKEQYFYKALPYLEQAYRLQASPVLRQNIFAIYTDLGNPEKASQWTQQNP